MQEIILSDLLIATGWCAYNKGHQNKNRSIQQNESTYLARVWLPHILGQITPGAIMVYASKADIPPATGLFNFDNANIVFSHKEANTLAYRHDWVASILVAAGYALANDMDLLFIEQDCLVCGLDEIARLAQGSGNAIYYGFGENASYKNGWAELSLFYVSRRLLLAAMWALLLAKDVGDDNPQEPLIHKAIMGSDIGRYFNPWPFGSGRKRPIPFKDDLFYAQQLTDDELVAFLEMLSIRTGKKEKDEKREQDNGQ
jgi:hypothetical protein